MSKRCNRCKLDLDESQFNRRSDSKSLRSFCKTCAILSAKEARHKKNPPKPKLTEEEKAAHKKDTFKRFNAKPERKAKQAHYEALRRAAKLQATPSWLTQDQLDCIELHYALARYLSQEYGQEIEVDHQIPLKGVEVKGLHVPWNLQLMVKKVNQKKGNRLESLS